MLFWDYCSINRTLYIVFLPYRAYPIMPWPRVLSTSNFQSRANQKALDGSYSATISHITVVYKNSLQYFTWCSEDCVQCRAMYQVRITRTANGVLSELARQILVLSMLQTCYLLCSLVLLRLILTPRVGGVVFARWCVATMCCGSFHVRETINPNTGSSMNRPRWFICMGIYSIRIGSPQNAEIEQHPMVMRKCGILKSFEPPCQHYLESRDGFSMED